MTCTGLLAQPLFYTSHAFYDRIFHFLMTSPELKQTLNMTWGVRQLTLGILSSKEVDACQLQSTTLCVRCEV